MSATEILSLFGGASGGTAIVFCVLFITGWIYPKSTVVQKDEEIRELKRTIELERERSNAGVVAGGIVKDVMTAFRKELTP